MLKQKLTICLLGLMCLSSVSGVLTVICYGPDGHTAVEAVVHNHCECSETTETGNKDKFAVAAIDSLTDHNHCKDTIATSSIVAPARKNVKQSVHKILITTLLQKSNVADASICNSVALSNQSSSFHMPLRTIILLA